MKLIERDGVYVIEPMMKADLPLLEAMTGRSIQISLGFASTIDLLHHHPAHKAGQIT